MMRKTRNWADASTQIATGRSHSYPHREFFGPMKNTEDVVEIKGTTIEAFKTMLNYIYIPSKSENSPPRT